MTFNVQLNGDEAVASLLKQVPARADKAARLAINDGLRKGRTMAKRDIIDQVNLTSGYLDGRSSKGRRLDVYQASAGQLTGRIVGRREPTSLARFISGNTTGKKVRKQGLTFNVKRRKAIQNTFLLRLKSGNRGVAIRVPKGDPIRAKTRAAKKIFGDRNSDVYLLYGPSIQQVLQGNAVREGTFARIRGPLNEFVRTEFFRQFGRLS